jgi:chemotaxis protein histidine kinase CheA
MVESEPNRGTTVRVRIPMAKTVTQSQPGAVTKEAA